MDTIQKLTAFLETARSGTFSGAARKLHVSPSVITKRINELEADLGKTLFRRSTRHVVLNDDGQAYFQRIQQVVKDIEDIRLGRFLSPDALEGEIRLRTMTGPTLSALGKVVLDFRKEHPGIRLNIVTTEQPGNPIDAGVDIAIGFDALSYDGVFEEVVHRRPRVICAAPTYLAERGRPHHPHELSQHDCLAFAWAGSVWAFKSAANTIHVDVRPILTSTNGEVLRLAARDGHGIVELSLQTASGDIRKGDLVAILEDYPLADMWMKIMVPESRLHVARVAALLDSIRSHLFSEEGDPAIVFAV